LRILKITIEDETFRKVEKIATLKDLTPEILIKKDVEEMVKSFEESFELIF